MYVLIVTELGGRRFEWWWSTVSKFWVIFTNKIKSISQFKLRCLTFEHYLEYSSVSLHSTIYELSRILHLGAHLLYILASNIYLQFFGIIFFVYLNVLSDCGIGRRWWLEGTLELSFQSRKSRCCRYFKSLIIGIHP